MFQLPQLWIGGKYIGNEKQIQNMHEEGQLSKIMKEVGLTVPAVNVKPTGKKVVIYT